MTNFSEPYFICMFQQVLDSVDSDSGGSVVQGQSKAPVHVRQTLVFDRQDGQIQEVLDLDLHPFILLPLQQSLHPSV